MPGQLPVFAVVAQGRPRYTMPDKDEPDQADPGRPAILPGRRPATAERHSPRGCRPASGGRWAPRTSPGQDNPWFARAFVNRIWYALMGEAFYEPIDDLGPERTPRAPEVLEPLADAVAEGADTTSAGCSARSSTRPAYQRRVRSTASAAGKTPFASSCPSRLRSDQIFEALVEALGTARGPGPRRQRSGPRRPRPGTPWPRRRPGHARRPRRPRPRPRGWPARPWPPRVRAGSSAWAARACSSTPLRRRSSVPNDDVLGTIPQALFLMNSPMVNNRTQARPGTVLGEILDDRPRRPGRPRRPLPARALPPADPEGGRDLRRSTWRRRQPRARHSKTSTGPDQSTEFITANGERVLLESAAGIPVGRCPTNMASRNSLADSRSGQARSIGESIEGDEHAGRRDRCIARRWR